MGLFDISNCGNKMDINQAVADMEDGTILLDVREPEEYNSGHIPGSINTPVSHPASLLEIVPDRDTKVFVYCRSGSRSGRAQRFLKKNGFSNVVNIGGIRDYKGPLER